MNTFNNLIGIGTICFNLLQYSKYGDVRILIFCQETSTSRVTIS